MKARQRGQFQIAETFWGLEIGSGQSDRELM
jgi:hypothetical protein